MAARASYVRFVVGGWSEDPYWMDGILGAARRLGDDGKLEPHELEILRVVFAWFNENIPVPPFKEKLRRGEWSPGAVAWFKDDAHEAIQRMWDVVAILKEHGLPVRFFQSDDPGGIVYMDDWQIVAETPT